MHFGNLITQYTLPDVFLMLTSIQCTNKISTNNVLYTYI